MDKIQVIKALQIGLSEAIDIIKFLKPKDPQILAALTQLNQLLTYSEHVHDDHPSKKYPAYTN